MLAALLVSAFGTLPFKQKWQAPALFRDCHYTILPMLWILSQNLEQLDVDLDWSHHLSLFTFQLDLYCTCLMNIWPYNNFDFSLFSFDLYCTCLLNIWPYNDFEWIILCNTRSHSSIELFSSQCPLWNMQTLICNICPFLCIATSCRLYTYMRLLSMQA